MSGAARSLIVGTAGHIDHGKSVLVRALTGIDPDRLPEEKRRGITIDLGFASTEIQDGDGSSICLSFVDVPGHRLFVRNMLAGVGGIDCVMLVISAEDGVMPQTEEHLAICALLGVSCGVAVVTKADLVSEERLAEVRAEVESFLASSFLRNSPLLTVSAFDGGGLPDLRRTLALLASRKVERDHGGQLRLPLDRAFVMKGFGTVVTGTLQAGSLERGEALMLEPGSIPVKVRGLQIHGNSQQRALAGSRVAVNLAGVEVGEVHRGATLVRASSLEAVDTVDAEVALLDDSPELRHRVLVRFHCFTSESVATVLLYGQRALEPGGKALVRIKLAKPVVLLPDDRFVLRRLSPARTIGGGLVLDAQPVARKRRREVAAWLEKVAGATREEQIQLRVERRGFRGLSIASLMRELGWTKETVAEVVLPLLRSGELIRLSGDLLVARQYFSAAQALVLDQVTEHSRKANAGVAGVKRSELRNHTGLGAELFDAVIAELVAAKKLRPGCEAGTETIALSQAASQLPEADRARMAAIAAAYEKAGLTAPLFAEVIRKVGLNETIARRLMTLLLRDKTLVKLGADDLYMHRSALLQLQQQVKTLRGESLDVARFKQITGLSRKYAIPLLEYLDREHITRRQGDSRVVL